MSETGERVPDSLWYYAPNKGAPVFFAVAFGISTAYHLWQTIHYKCWRTTGVLIFAGLLFTVGFAWREVAAFNYSSLVDLLVSQCLIYGAPPLYELANYQILGRILYYVPHLSPIHPGRVLTTFAFISAVIESLNANGAVNAFNSSLPEKRQNLGKSLLKAALLMQLIVVVLFISLAGTFHRRIRRAGVVRPGIYTVLWSLYASSALITARTIYRTAEYFGVAAIKIGQGVDDADLGVEIRYEWFFYVFEAVLMLCNAWLGNIKHPRKYLPKSTKMYLARDGVTEIEGPGYKDTRKFIVTLIDPFDLASLFKRSGQHGAFWDEDAQGHKSGEGTTTVVDSAMEKRNKNTTAENV